MQKPLGELVWLQRESRSYLLFDLETKCVKLNSMREWQQFPLWEQRPADVHIYTEAEREELESIIAGQISMLLADYAVANVVEIDNSDCKHVDGSKSYYVLEVDPFLLEDDSEIQLHKHL
jgi:hypothetical protein